MWRCIRCEKENQDAAEICVECGHARTMDYMYHRTLSKIPEKVAANWKIVHDTSKEVAQENRKAATEFIEGVEDIVTGYLRAASDRRNEINRLRGVVEECDRKIEKIDRADARIEKILYPIVVLLLLVSAILAYPDVKNWPSYIDDIFGITKIASVGDLFATVLSALTAMIFLYLIFAIFYGILLFEIKRLTDRNKKLEQVTTERDNAQKALDTMDTHDSILTNQSQINFWEENLLRIRKDRENLINQLAQVSPENMRVEYDKLMRGESMT